MQIKLTAEQAAALFEVVDKYPELLPEHLRVPLRATFAIAAKSQGEGGADE